jgi:hypothetical protein
MTTPVRLALEAYEALAARDSPPAPGGRALHNAPPAIPPPDALRRTTHMVFIISAKVALFLRCSMAITWAVLLPWRGVVILCVLGARYWRQWPCGPPCS